METTNTTITIRKETWRKLNKKRIHPEITFDQVISNLIKMEEEKDGRN